MAALTLRWLGAYPEHTLRPGRPGRTWPARKSARRLGGMVHCRRAWRAATSSDLVPGIAGRSSMIARRWIMARAASQDMVVLGAPTQAEGAAERVRPRGPRRAGGSRRAARASRSRRNL